MKKPFHQGAASGLFENAKALRKRQTDAENILWEHLRNRRFHGLKFRRQHPLGSYIADFYCHELNLVIEADGAVHDKDEQRLYDANRTQTLTEGGVTVVRFANNDLENDISHCLNRLERLFLLKPET